MICTKYCTKYLLNLLKVAQNDCTQCPYGAESPMGLCAQSFVHFVHFVQTTLCNLCNALVTEQPITFSINPYFLRAGSRSPTITPNAMSNQTDHPLNREVYAMNRSNIPRRHLRAADLWLPLVMILVATLVGFWTAQAHADIVQVQWTNPTAYSNNAPLPPAQITRSRVEYGTAAASTACAFGTRIADTVATGSVTSATTPDLPIGSYAFRVYTTASGVESVASLPACKAIAQSPPNAPTGVTVIVTINVATP